jgi:hypothetical protein
MAYLYTLHPMKGTVLMNEGIRKYSKGWIFYTRNASQLEIGRNYWKMSIDVRYGKIQEQWNEYKKVHWWTISVAWNVIDKNVAVPMKPWVMLHSDISTWCILVLCTLYDHSFYFILMIMDDKMQTLTMNFHLHLKCIRIERTYFKPNFQY